MLPVAHSTNCKPPITSHQGRVVPMVVSANQDLGHHGMPTRRQLLTATTLQACVLVPTLEASAKQAASTAGDWSSPGLAAPVDPSAPKFFTTQSGVRVQELAIGKGNAVTPTSRVLVDYVLRRANGYFIYSTVEGVSFQPRDIPVGPVALQLGDGRVLVGLEEALQGMAEGGKRRVLIPPSLGYSPDLAQQPLPPGFAARRQVATHRDEPLLFEVQVLRVT